MFPRSGVGASRFHNLAFMRSDMRAFARVVYFISCDVADLLVWWMLLSKSGRMGASKMLLFVVHIFRICS